MFIPNSKVAKPCPQMSPSDYDFDNVKVIQHELDYHQQVFSEAWMTVKVPNAGNDHIVITEVYKWLAGT